MPNFQNAYEDLMDMVSRPTSETTVLAAAKREINNAIRILQRRHCFVKTEEVDEGTYTAAAQFVDFTTLLPSVTALRSLGSVQILTATGALEGKPVKILSYAQLQSLRMRVMNKMPAGASITFDGVTDFLDALSLEESFRPDKIAIVTGTQLGLYPRQNEAINLLLHYYKWLPTLNATSDTNFFLDFAYDVVLTIALRRMHIYMKADSRYVVAKEEVDSAIADLIAWDTSLRETSIS